MIDDAVFMAMDVAGGYKSFEDAGMAFGKKALTTAATSFAGAAFSGVSAAAGSSATTFLTKGGIAGALTKNVASTVSKVAIKTAVTGVQTIATSAASSAINAINWSSSSGFGFSKSAYKNGLSSIGSIASSMASTMVTSSLGEWNTGNKAWKLLGFSEANKKNVGAFNSLAGGLAGQAVGYAFGGNINLNLVNFSMFGIKGVGTDEITKMGLFELSIGRNGITGNIGTGGLDVSYGAIASAMKGLEAWKVNAKIWGSGQDAASEYKVALRTLYSGDKTNKAEFNAILDGSTRIEKYGRVAQTESVFDEDTGIKTIYLGSDALNDGSKFGLGVILSHESYRDGRDNGAEGQRIETDNAVAGHIRTVLGLMGTYGVGSIGEAMSSEAKKFSDAATKLSSTEPSEREAALKELVGIFGSYDSSADYWRVMKDGNIVWDNSLDLNDEDGNLLRKYEGSGNGGKTAALAEHLGVNADIAKSMIIGAGIDRFENGSFVNAKGEDIAFNSEYAINTSDSFKASYFIQRDYVDKVWSNYGGDMAAAMNAARNEINSFIDQNLGSGQISNVVLEQYKMLGNLDIFANTWNKAMYGDYGKSGMEIMGNQVLSLK